MANLLQAIFALAARRLLTWIKSARGGRPGFAAFGVARDPALFLSQIKSPARACP